VLSRALRSGGQLALGCGGPHTGPHGAGPRTTGAEKAARGSQFRTPECPSAPEDRTPGGRSADHRCLRWRSGDQSAALAGEPESGHVEYGPPDSGPSGLRRAVRCGTLDSGGPHRLAAKRKFDPRIRPPVGCGAPHSCDAECRLPENGPPLNAAVRSPGVGTPRRRSAGPRSPVLRSPVDRTNVRHAGLWTSAQCGGPYESARKGISADLSKSSVLKSASLTARLWSRDV